MVGAIHHHGDGASAGASKQTPRSTQQTGGAGAQGVSIAAMNWAWQQPLSPALKLILMALSDAADDSGICWPSVSSVAVKCNLSTRTVRRGIQALIASGLLVSEPRYRKDGSCSSNRYRLQLTGGDKLSRAPVRADSTPGQGCQGDPDTRVIPRTTTGTQIESPPPRATATEMVVSGSGTRGGGDLFDLEYPSALSATEREEAGNKLAGIPVSLAQELLDELTSSMKGNVIQSTPLAYLRGLIKRARDGTFTPEGALQVAGHRKRRAEVEAAMRRNEDWGRDYPPAAADAENPLVKKMLDIQKRSQEKRR